MPHALLPVPPVKRWRRHMFSLIPLVLQFMPYRLSIGPPVPLTPMLLLPENEIGNTSTCLNWGKPDRADIDRVATFSFTVRGLMLSPTANRT